MAEHDSITNAEDVIDSREVIERIEYLRDALAAYADDDTDDGDRLDDDEREELTALEELAKEGEHFSDWEYGATLIRDTYFVDYAQELAEDIGAVNRDASWPAYCIDWERAARDLQVDYSAVDFDGVTYWIR